MADVNEGFWGPVTANIDWCEANYEVTYYIAEFWNTISNLGLILLSIVGAFEGWRGREIEFTFILPFVAMTAVGIGSTLFHMSLLYHLQLWDEFPMIWGSASMIYSIHCIDKSWRYHNARLASFLFFCCLLSTSVYIILDARLIFEGTFAALVICSVIMFGRRIYKDDRPSFIIFLLSNLAQVVAFAFWITDRICCDQLRELRQWLPPALQPFTQFHAVWHVLVAIGVDMGIILALRLRFILLHKSYRFGFRCGILPYYAPGSMVDVEEGRGDYPKVSYKN